VRHDTTWSLAGKWRPMFRAVLAAVLVPLWAFVSPAHAAVTFVAATTSAASGGAVFSLSIAKPAGTGAGDLILAQIVMRNSTAVTITPPGSPNCSWNQIGAQPTNGDLRVALYYCVATSSEPTAYTWSFSDKVRVGGSISVFRGVDTSSPIDANGSQAGSGSAISAPSVTTTVSAAALVAFFATANGSTTQSTPVPPMQNMAGAGVTDGAGPNGVSLAASWELQSSVGASGSRTATGASVNNLGWMVALKPAGGIDHYAITHSGNAVTCQAENVTITAKDAANTAISANGAMITITAHRTAGAAGNHGDWTLMTGTGTLANGTADDGVATYIFGAGESQVVLALKDTHVQTVNIDVVDGNGITEASGAGSTEKPFDANLTFAQAGFRITDSAGTPTSIATQTAAVTSTTYALQAIRTDTSTGACVGVFANGADVSVDLAFQCNDPIACQAGQNVSLTNNAVTETIAANPNSGVTTFTTRWLRFGANSLALFTLSYPDVGRISLHARHNIPLGTGAPSGNFMTGSSNPFVVKPSSFVLSNIVRTSDSFANPGAVNASGGVFIRAGQAFSATVTAVNALGAATPNYGKEVAPEGVQLASALVGGLGLTNNPALGNPTGFGTFTNGVATGTTFTWAEVGIITLTPSVGDADYLGVGNVTGTTSGNVGRFHPDHFALSGTSLTNRSANSCSPASAFTYMDEPLRLQYTLTAQNATNGTTQNYNGAFAKLPISVAQAGLQNIGARDIAAATNLSSRLAIVGLAGSWSSGVATGVQATLAVARAAPDNPDGPFNQVKIGIAPADSDAVALPAGAYTFDIDGVGGNDHAQIGADTQIRYGRLRILNALGSEKLPLPISMRLEHWGSAGFGFVTNTLDSCTTLTHSNIALSNWQVNLGPCETAFPASITFANGQATAALAAPLPGSNNGSVDLRVDLSASSGQFCDGTGGAPIGSTPAAKSYLKGRWNATDDDSDPATSYDDDPTARATFGIYGPDRAPNRIIYQRENY